MDIIFLPYGFFYLSITDPDVAWGMVGVPSSCALLGGFAIGARGNIAANAKGQRSSACTVLALCMVCFVERPWSIGAQYWFTAK